MRRISISLLIVALLLVTPLAVGGTAAQAESSVCTSVSGTIRAVSIPRFDGDALVGFDVVVMDATGLLAGGEVTASLDVTQFLADGSIEFTGKHTFTDTDAGSFVTADHGITTADGGVADSLAIVGGGTGFLVTMGHIDLATGELELGYYGMVCDANE